MLRGKQAFTIVELLIVIVVIAILTAITIVAYNGIQNRANNSAILSDISTLAKKLELYKIDHSNTYPMSSSDLTATNLKLSGGAYDTTDPIRNALFCFTSDGSGYAFLAKSKSGSAYMKTHTTAQVQSFTTSWTTSTPASGLCSGLGAPFSTSLSAGYYTAWSSWANI